MQIGQGRGIKASFVPCSVLEDTIYVAGRQAGRVIHGRQAGGKCANAGRTGLFCRDGRTYGSRQARGNAKKSGVRQGICTPTLEKKVVFVGGSVALGGGRTQTL
jgi:hypothetical protein